MTDGSKLLDDVVRLLKTYVVFGEHEAHACALHIAATHAQPAWHHATRLVIKSPHKRCGKSRLMDILAELSHHSLITVNISVAALVRMLDSQDPPTLHLDEADTVFGKKAAADHEDLRGILNAGFQRGRPYTRWDITTRQPEQMPTFCMATLAGIGDMPDTIEDRAVIINMRRRGAGDPLPKPYRLRRDQPELMRVQEALHEWARAHLGELADAEPVMPVEDRDADKWEPLIAMADLAGGDWPERARTACKELCGIASDDDDDPGVRLLRDLRDVFGDVQAMKTNDILVRLYAIEESPWRKYGRDGLDPNGMARLLKPYHVKSQQSRWEDGDNVRGYFRHDGRPNCVGLEDAWSRYCPVREA